MVLIDPEVDETVVLQGRDIRFATVDLMYSPADIRSLLLRLLNVNTINDFGEFMWH